MENLFSNGEAHGWLLLISDQRQINIEQVFCGLDVTGNKAVEHLHEHLGIRESRHCAIGTSTQFERVVERTVPDKNTDAPNSLLLRLVPYRGDLSEPGTIFVLQHDHLWIGLHE